MDRKQNSVNRRTLLAGAVGLTAATALGAKPQAEKYRVGLIGHTGRGGYGHGLDKVWRDVPAGRIVAIADPNPKGLAGAIKRAGGSPKGYGDYLKMLDEAKIDILTVGPTYIDRHCETVLAAAERKVRGIYIEKPLCRTLEEADLMVAACDKHKVKLAMAHQTYYVPTMTRVAEIVSSGKLGRILEFRGRCKEDHRGGGIGLWVLGTRILAMMKRFGGDPISCTATVLQNGKPITAKDITECKSYGIGPLAGDEIHAMYRLAGGAVGYFDSVKRAGAGWPSRYGMQIFGTKGVVDIHSSELMFPAVYYLDDPLWYPGQSGKKWIAVTSAGIGKPEPLKGENSHHGGNVLAVKDLISSIEKEGQPTASLAEARANIEMIAAVYESVRTGSAAKIPLKNRRNPLTMLK